MKFYKKPLVRYLNHKLDKEPDKPEEQHEYHKIQLLLAYLDEPRITTGEYMARSTAFFCRFCASLREDTSQSVLRSQHADFGGV